MIHRFLPLLWRNVWRNKRRAILTILGVAVAIYVFVALGAVIAGLTFPVREVGASQVLSVREASRANVLASRLPTGYEQRVSDVEGVAEATGVLQYLCVIGAEGIHLFLRGVDADRFAQVRQIEVAPGAWDAFRQDRRGALVGYRLLEQMGWKVGGETEIESIGLRVTVVGVIPKQGIDLENHMLVHRALLQQNRSAEGQVSYVLAAPAPGSSPSAVAAAIDEACALAPVPTETTTKAGFAEAIVEDYGGFLSYMRLMGAITVLITMLGAANAIAMNVRERTRELGVLRAIGFPPGLVVSTILWESALLSTLGGAVGIALAVLTMTGDAAQLRGLFITVPEIGIALLVAVLIGIAGGLIPALVAARLRPVEALRVVD